MPSQSLMMSSPARYPETTRIAMGANSPAPTSLPSCPSIPSLPNYVKLSQRSPAVMRIGIYVPVIPDLSVLACPA